MTEALLEEELAGCGTPGMPEHSLKKPVRLVSSGDEPQAISR